MLRVDERAVSSSTAAQVDWEKPHLAHFLVSTLAARMGLGHLPLFLWMLPQSLTVLICSTRRKTHL